MTETLLQVENLVAGYGKIPILHEIDLTIQTGEIVALVGSNGAGKTTLLRALSCLIPSKGSIQFLGRSIDNLRPEEVFSLGLVQVPEGRLLFDRMSVEDNLLMGAYQQSDSSKIKSNLQRVYKMFPILKERKRQKAGSLSGGEQQMLAIARGFMAMPKLLMVDEMSLGLAPVIVEKLFDTLLEIRKEGVTILLVEQDVFSAIQVADRGYILESGRIVKHGTAKELSQDPEIQKAYFGI